MSVGRVRTTEGTDHHRDAVVGLQSRKVLENVGDHARDDTAVLTRPCHLGCGGGRAHGEGLA